MKAILIKHLPNKGAANRTFNKYFPLLSQFEIETEVANGYAFGVIVESEEILQKFKTCIAGGTDMQGESYNAFPIEEDERDCFVTDESDLD